MSDRAPGSEPGDAPLAPPADEADLELEDELEPDEPEPDEPELEEPDPDAEPEEPRQRRGGGSETVRNLRRARQETERQLAEARAQLSVFQQLAQQRAQQPAFDPAAQQRAQQQEQEALALMTPEERADYRIRQTEQRLGNQFALQQFQMADVIDRQGFEGSFARFPGRERYAQRVEDMLRQERQQGRNHSREVIYKYLLGEDQERRASRLAPGQRRAATARVAAQRTRPQNGAGTVPRSTGGGRNQDSDDERLLRNLTTADI